MTLEKDCISIRGARQNNLKGFDLDIPLNRLIVVTGVSGSGKSSLAFSTLYAEGQRRYIETFSPYARQFMDRMDKPRVDKIEGIPPAIAIEQGNKVRTSRSTVGTITELTDFVKLLFARISELHCLKCSRKVVRDTPDSIWDSLLNEEPGTRIILAFPYIRAKAKKEVLRQELLRLGFSRVLEGNKVVDIQDSGLNSREILIVVDRFVFKHEDRTRILDSIEQGLSFGGGRLVARIPGAKDLLFSTGLHCPYCDISYKDPLPNLFSFNSPLGACETCRGFGRTIDIDLDQVIPDTYMSLSGGAIKPWGTDRKEYSALLEFCHKHQIPTDVPFRELTEEQKAWIVNGTKGFYGVRGFFRWLEGKSYKMHVRVFLSHYRGYFACPECNGTRFKAESLLYRINGLNIAEVYSLSITKALEFFESLEDRNPDEASTMILREILSRLTYLNDVGLSYLTLDRQSRTLSGGEVERVSLTKALGSSLVNALYVLDEPSIGLHARDSRRLLGLLKQLSRENTVVVVEHDPEIINGADYILDLGPGAGEKGGNVVYWGPLSEAAQAAGGTIDYITGKKSVRTPERRREPVKGRVLRIQGAEAHNLKKVDVSIPLGMTVCLTGVSGTGKSTLAEEIVYRGVRREKGYPAERPGKYEAMYGAAFLKDAVLIDQDPIGRTPRSNPVSYMGAFDPIRNLFSKSPLAVDRKYRPGMFSFNTAGGRCEACGGNGFEKVEMQFLSDVYITCPDCNGLRYKKEVLDVEYRGKNIGDVLQMTSSQALEFFKDHPAITNSLKPLIDIGLGYLRLGQPINTLSGGESQRLKLAKYLSAGTRKPILFILDEPTTGLHFEDIEILLHTFDRLVEAGHSVLIIEHNMDVIKCADHVIDLGPEGGDEGGRIVAEGTPEEIARSANSHTGRFLREYLDQPHRSEDSKSERFCGLLGHSNCITVTRARQHNLKEISVSIPRDQFVVITGISGSGKSTLAFDVLFGEGQRRYIESLPTYVRQYLSMMERPDVDLITGIPPTVAIEQRMAALQRRSTVATITEVYHYLRLLFSKTGTQHCLCGKPVSPLSDTEILDRINSRFAEREVLFLAPKVERRKGTYKELFREAMSKGYQVRIDGALYSLVKIPVLERYKEHTIDFITGKIRVLPENQGVIKIALERIVQEGKGTFYVLDPRRKEEERFSKEGYCPDCGTSFEEPDPRIFSFNNRFGACPDCEGLGIAGDNGSVCRQCNGARLNEKALRTKVGEYNIAEFTSLSVEDALSRLPALPFADSDRLIAEMIIPEIRARLEFLEEVGLSYLTLNRSGDTLSGGETQRIRLAAQLGSNLRGVCYILDEPTIGLHPRDNDRLIGAIRRLKERGNTAVIVEHDEETILNADWVIDLGPGAGSEGGRVIAEGRPAEIARNSESVTGKSLSNIQRRRITSRQRGIQDKWLTMKGAALHNLKNIDVSIPLGALVCITGVSGSGKSTLLKETFLTGVKELLSTGRLSGGSCAEIDGWKDLDRVLEVDHSPIGRTPRSTPGTYIGFYDTIRQLFAGLPDSRARGYSAGRFSFNVKGGRCESCRGEGRLRIEMNFLPDIYVDCEVCSGRRFNEETLNIKYKGKNIAEVLEMTTEECIGFFSSVPRIANPMRILSEMGLGYLRMGQPSNTLSGGEAQRIKLAYELCKGTQRKTLYVLDEPTTGLHLADIEKLMAVLQKLVDLGNTVAVIEHNLEVIKEADYIIDLGPEGGADGGRIVAQGTPHEILESGNGSYTAEFLRKYILEATKAQRHKENEKRRAEY